MHSLFSSLNINTHKYKIYNLTQLTVRQSLKCIFNRTSQLHVSTRPSGAIFMLKLFERLYVQLTMLVDYETSYCIAVS